MSSNEKAFIQVSGQPIYFQEDWGTGIGGGLWSTGEALARYFDTPHAHQQLVRLATSSQKLSFLELGSGNGLLSICWAALWHTVQHTATLSPHFEKTIVVTDTAEHLPLIHKTLEANPHLTGQQQQPEKPQKQFNIHVAEHLWGKFETKGTSLSSSEINPHHSLLDGSTKFDFIVGSDVAYRKELYDPLIASLQQFSHHQTIILLGCTMVDTTPSFFDLLRKAGFSYRRLSDHVMPPGFVGQQTFGIFVLQRR